VLFFCLKACWLSLGGGLLHIIIQTIRSLTIAARQQVNVKINRHLY